MGFETIDGARGELPVHDRPRVDVDWDIDRPDPAEDD